MAPACDGLTSDSRGRLQSPVRHQPTPAPGTRHRYGDFVLSQVKKALDQQGRPARESNEQLPSLESRILTRVSRFSKGLGRPQEGALGPIPEQVPIRFQQYLIKNSGERPNSEELRPTAVRKPRNPSLNWRRSNGH